MHPGPAPCVSGLASEGLDFAFSPPSLRTQPEPGLASRMAIHRAVLTCLGLPLFLLPGARGPGVKPRPPAAPDLNPSITTCVTALRLGHHLGSHGGAGVGHHLRSSPFFIILVASLPFAQDTKKLSLLGDPGVLPCLGTLGLFWASFACVVKPDFSICAPASSSGPVRHLFLLPGPRLWPPLPGSEEPRPRAG